MDRKGRVINLLRDNVNREGIEKLINMLEKSDYFTAPASANHHLNYEGGLVEHSLNVYDIYMSLRDKYKLNNKDKELYISKESVIIEALLHDICKIGKYKKELKNKWTDKTKSYLISLMKRNPVKVAENNIKIDEQEDLVYKYASDLINWFNGKRDKLPKKEDYKKEWGWDYRDDYLPVGHGEKSVVLAQRFMNLEKREILAIRWHMSAWESSVTDDRNRNHRDAIEMYPDVHLMQLADYQSTFKENLDRGIFE